MSRHFRTGRKGRAYGMLYVQASALLSGIHSTKGNLVVFEGIAATKFTRHDVYSSPLAPFKCAFGQWTSPFGTLYFGKNYRTINGCGEAKRLLVITDFRVVRPTGWERVCLAFRRCINLLLFCVTIASIPRIVILFISLPAIWSEAAGGSLIHQCILGSVAFVLLCGVFIVVYSWGKLRKLDAALEAELTALVPDWRRR